MASRPSPSVQRLRAEVIRIVEGIPEGRFTTYGSIAAHLGVHPRHVASVLSHFDEGESARLPWHRVVAAEGRVSRGMAEELRAEQQSRLEAEGFRIDGRGFLLDSDSRFHVVGARHEGSWRKR